MLDVETTGFGRYDRIVELGVVFLSSTLEPRFEFETLINPNRGMAASEVHGISADAVGLAPQFHEIAAYLASLLNGCVLVAHNLSFDARFLQREFAAASVNIDLGIGVDTFGLTKQNLAAACRAFAIEAPQAHWALGDARATAELLRLLGPPLDTAPIMASTGDVGKVRTHRRDLISSAATLPPKPVNFSGHMSSELSYLATLDHFLNDLILDDRERLALEDLREDFGLSRIQVETLHFEYFKAYVDAAQADHFVSDSQHEALHLLAEALNISQSDVPPASRQERMSLEPGMRVCFTGNGLDKDALRAAAQNAGLVSVESVTKGGCDFVVVASMSDLTGKAKAAIKFGKPRITVNQFMDAL